MEKKVKLTTTDAKVHTETETIVILKCTRKLTDVEYKTLAKRIRTENEASGVKIVLVPSVIDEIEVKEDA